MLVFFIIIEGAGYPPTSWGLPFLMMPAGPPPAYKWLMQQANNDPLIELPMEWEPEEVGGAFGLDTVALYWSLFHGRRTVNGLSPFPYPEYKILTDQMKLFPSPETIGILRSLGVRYIVLHVGKLPRLDWQKELVRQHPEAGYDWEATLARLNRFGDDLAMRGIFGADRVYEIVPAGAERPYPAIPRGEKLSCKGWIADASTNCAAASYAIDGMDNTSWATADSQRAGYRFQLDLGKTQAISGISMLLRNINECPKNPVVEISEDGYTWKEVPYTGAYRNLIQRLLLNPKDRLFRIDFPSIRARYIRMTLTRFDNLYPWSMSELAVYGTR
jgi:hypothetical protein